MLLNLLFWVLEYRIPLQGDDALDSQDAYLKTWLGKLLHFVILSQ